MLPIWSKSLRLCLFVCLPDQSIAQSVDLLPGQWQVRHSVQVPAQGFAHTENSQFCLAEEDASLTFDRILEELNFAECTARNVVITQSTGQADIRCEYPEYGNVVANGRMTANFGEDAYRIEAQMQGVGVGVLNVSYVGVGTHVGSC